MASCGDVGFNFKSILLVVASSANSERQIFRGWLPVSPRVVFPQVLLSRLFDILKHQRLESPQTCQSVRIRQVP
jgi:hypothetical protein